MKLGEKQVLTVVKTVEFGVYLGTENDKVLLPKKQVPKDIEPGESDRGVSIQGFLGQTDCHHQRTEAYAGRACGAGSAAGGKSRSFLGLGT